MDFVISLIGHMRSLTLYSVKYHLYLGMLLDLALLAH